MTTAFPELYEQHRDAIRAFLRARVHDDALAEDLTAETFTKAFAARDRFVDQGHGERPWLFAIATNVLRDELRAGTRRAQVLDRLPADGHVEQADPGGDPVLADALKSLRREELEVLLLSAWADLSYEEIAATLDIPVGTVRSRLHRARKHLRKALVAGAAAGVALVAALALWPSGDGRGPARPAILRGPEPASARQACARPGPAGRCLRAVSLVAGLSDLPGSGDVLYERGSYIPLAFVIDDKAGGPGNHLRVRSAHTPIHVGRHAVEENWLAPDGTLRMSHEDGGRVRFDSPEDAQAWRDAGRPDLERLIPPAGPERPLSQDTDDAAAQLLGANGLHEQLPPDGDPLARLPREPAALAQELRRMAIGSRRTEQEPLITQTVSGFVSTLLDYPASPADLRAALIKVLADMPGSTSLGLITMPGGARVAAIRLDGDHVDDAQDIIAFDPDTGALRGRATTGDDGVVRWQRTMNDTRARVARLGERP